MKTLELTEFEIMHARHAVEHYIKEIGRDKLMSISLKTSYYKELVQLLDKLVKAQD